MLNSVTNESARRRMAGWAAALAIACASPSPILAADSAIPNFAPDSRTGWLKPAGDEFIQPESGPGPVKSDPAHPYIPNSFPFVPRDQRQQETIMIADLTNPILQPWVIEQMRKSNEEVLAGKTGFTARSRCWPHGVPGFLLYPVHPIFFIQTAKEVVMSWGQDFQLRRVYLDVPHSADPKPSWYGESVGHYENGDTLVVDTIGFNDRTYVDNYRTPHTTKLHVVERFRLLPGGQSMVVNARVEDPGAFTMPWNGIQRFRQYEAAVRKIGVERITQLASTPEGPLQEMICADNPNSFLPGTGGRPIPQTLAPDF